MKILNKLTISSLTKNKKRSIVTIIGIILSTALLTAVTAIGMSFWESIVESERLTSGSYHTCFYNVPAEETGYITENRDVKDTALFTEGEFAILEGSINRSKPYMYISGINEAAYDIMNISIIEGRKPVSSDEVLISRHIKSNGGVAYKVGDTITLQTGHRLGKYDSEMYLTQDYEYDSEGETFVPEETKTYKIVGIVDRPIDTLEPFWSPGYSIFTVIDDDYSGCYTAYAEFKDADSIFSGTGAILGADGDVLEDQFMNGGFFEGRYNYNYNTYLIKYQALKFGDSTIKMLYIMIAIVSAIIVFASVMCISNSFNISISEKQKQYGMLASVGATSKQIKKNVYYEAAILGSIGIIVGVFAGNFATWVLVKVINSLMDDTLNFKLIFNVSILAIIASIILAIITIYLSAGIPARRASKVSAIDAIRESGKFKVKYKNRKAPHYVSKLFGIGGVIAWKNMKRNKKKYRVSIFSIISSVTVFIALFYFMSLIFGTAKFYVDEIDYNVNVITSSKQTEELINRGEAADINRYSVIRYSYLHVDPGSLTYNQFFKDWDFDGNNISVSVLAVGEDEYQHYIDTLDLKYDDVYDKGILINNFVVYDDGYKDKELYTASKGDIINGTLSPDDAPVDTTIELAAVVSERPLGYEDLYTDGGFLVVSEDWFEKHNEVFFDNVEAYFDADDPYEIEEEFSTMVSENGGSVNNVEQAQNSMKSTTLVIGIFLYGFIAVITLIGITNIFNTITTSMELRSKEFAMMRSVGMTGKEFRRMIRLETIFYGSKALIIGIILGSGLCYLLNMNINDAELYTIEFELPWFAILISIAAVFILLFGIMTYSLAKVKKQNIIDTIRTDAI